MEFGGKFHGRGQEFLSIGDSNSRDLRTTFFTPPTTKPQHPGVRYPLPQNFLKSHRSCSLAVAGESGIWLVMVEASLLTGSKLTVLISRCNSA